LPLTLYLAGEGQDCTPWRLWHIDHHAFCAQSGWAPWVFSTNIAVALDDIEMQPVVTVKCQTEGVVFVGS